MSAEGQSSERLARPPRNRQGHETEGPSVRRGPRRRGGSGHVGSWLGPQDREKALGDHKDNPREVWA